MKVFVKWLTGSRRGPADGWNPTTSPYHAFLRRRNAWQLGIYQSFHQKHHKTRSQKNTESAFNRGPFGVDGGSMGL
jgi:hypothetical protein